MIDRERTLTMPSVLQKEEEDYMSCNSLSQNDSFDMNGVFDGSRLDKINGNNPASTISSLRGSPNDRLNEDNHFKFNAMSD